MNRILLASAVILVSFAFVPVVASHGGDQCSPGLIKSAEKHAENAWAKYERYSAQAAALDGENQEKAAAKAQARADAAMDRFDAAVADLAAHVAACA